MVWLQKLDETFDSGDPEVRTWFLVRQTSLPFLLCASYVFFSTVLGPALMRNRKPLDLKKSMIVFNFLVVGVYATALCIVVNNLPRISWEMFCRGGVVISGEPTYKLAVAGWMIYVIKYFEFLDTVFFVLRKKQNQITVLHVVHHTLVPIVGWIIGRTERGGMQSFPVLINAFVHIIMYTYYGLSAMGPQVRKYLWWKKYLTQLQMVQFVLMILFVTLVAPMSGCTMAGYTYIMYIFIAPLFLYLFYKYYQSAFKQKKPCP